MDTEPTRRSTAFEALFQASLDGVLLTAPDGRILDANPTACALLGQSREAIIAGGRDSIVDPGDPVHPADLDRRDPMGQRRATTWWQRGDGARFPVSLSSTLFQDVNGETRAVIVFRDLTHQHALSLITDRPHSDTWVNLTKGVLVCDPNLPDTPLIYVNRAFEQITGYPAAEAIGRNCRFLHGADHNQPGLTRLRRALAENQPVHVVIRNYRKDGELYWNDLYISPVFDQVARLTYLVGIHSDVTHQITAVAHLLAAEREQARLEGVTWTARELAHRLNNQLAIAVSLTDLLLEATDQPDRAPIRNREIATNLMAALDRLTDDVARFQRVRRVRTYQTPVGTSLDLNESTG